MTRTSRRVTLALSVAAAFIVVVVACGTDTPSASPSGAATSAPTVSPPPVATPPSSSAATVCVVAPSEGQLPSDRLVDLRISSSATADRVTFEFGDPSLPGPAAPPQGSLQAAVPPFIEGDAPIEVRGERFVTVWFSGMSIANDLGQEVYQGPRDIAPGLEALRHVVMPGPFEGVYGFYVGYDGPGCVELGRDGNDVTLTIQRP